MFRLFKLFLFKYKHFLYFSFLINVMGEIYIIGRFDFISQQMTSL